MIVYLIHISVLVYSLDVTLELSTKPENTLSSFRCSSGSSNPRSHITWTMNGFDVTINAIESHAPGDYNADSVESVLYLNVTREMNGLMLVCHLHYQDIEVEQQGSELDVACKLLSRKLWKMKTILRNCLLLDHTIKCMGNTYYV